MIEASKYMEIKELQEQLLDNIESLICEIISKYNIKIKTPHPNSLAKYLEVIEISKPKRLSLKMIKR